MRLPFAVLFSVALLAQAPFKPNAQLGVPAQIGAISRIIGSNERIETGTLRELTLKSCELALTFPNRVENVVARADEKLLILRGSIRNPEKTSVIQIGSSSAIGFRLWERYRGKGKFEFVLHYDPVTLKHLNKQLKFGESGDFVGVWRVPADFRDFRLGAISEQKNIVAWYDLTEHIGKIQSVFAEADGIGVKPMVTVPAGTAVEIDGIEMGPGSLSRPARIAGAASDLSKPFHVVTVTATNRMLMPARWGWQYFTTELIGADGSATKAYPSIIDKATDAPWAGDLAAGASVTSQFQFYPSGTVQPKALRLTLNATGRSVEMALGR